MMELGQENNLEVCFENMGQWRGLELLELGELLDELDASMCFDTGHAFSEVGQEETEEFLDEYSHLISHLHLTDTREGRDMHLPIGSEEVGFKAIGEKLSDFDGTATMEIFTEDNDYILLSKKKSRGVLAKRLTYLFLLFLDQNTSPKADFQSHLLFLKNTSQ